jgi:hypothetical protein
VPPSICPWRYETVPELRRGLGRNFPNYNEVRLLQPLEYRTPGVVYREGRRSMEKDEFFFAPHVLGSKA